MENLLINITPQFWGYTLLFVGIALCYCIARRRFNRRGIGGLQHYNSFEKAVVVTFLEWCFKWVGVALILLRLFLIIK